MKKLVNSIPLIVVGLLIWWATSNRTISPKKAITTRPQIPQVLQKFEEFKVMSIHDGDTIKVADSKNEVFPVRFACMDAPELKQELGIQSRDELRNILNKGKVKLNILGEDRYKRKIAEVWTDSELVQSEMVGRGMAFAYDAYAKNCPSWSAVKEAEKTAISYKLGVWKNPGFQKPWEYRRNK